MSRWRCLPRRRRAAAVGVEALSERALQAVDDAPKRTLETTSLSVLVPVYNEQYLVETSLRRLLALAESPLLTRIQIIVVDDCSSDHTPQVLRRFERSASDDAIAKVEWLFLRHERNAGKGAAIRTGLEHASCDLTVIHDADLEYHPRDLLPMVRLFLAEGADAVFGSRFMAGGFKRALFFRHSIGNHILTFLCDLASDLNLTDMETCYKAFRREIIQSIPLNENRFGFEPEITVKISKRRLRVYEVGISYSGRTYEEGKKIGWKDGVRALWCLAKYGIKEPVARRTLEFDRSVQPNAFVRLDENQ